MKKVGFGFFGRPVGHRCISNGLFRSLQLEDETYLNLPNNINLAKGERIIKISRQAYDSNLYEVIKVYIFDYAESLSINKTGRGGGYVGSAYVFTGNPTQKLLYNAVKHVHSKVLKLLDENGKFKDRDFNINVNELVSPTENGLTIGHPQKANSQLNTDLYAIHTDGPVLNHLMSVVQGFMYNPNFKSLESIYVSDNSELLIKILNNDNKRLLGIGHLLNFQKYYQQSNKFLAQKREELQRLQKSIEEEKRKKGEEIESYLRKKQAKLDNTKRELNNKNKELEGFQSKIVEEHKKLEKLEEIFKRNEGGFEDLQIKIETSKAQVTSLKTEINSLNTTKYNSFEKLLEDKRFQSEKKKYLTNNSEIGGLKSRISELENEIRERDENKIPIKKKLRVVAGIILFFLILGYSTGALLPPRKAFNTITSIFKSPGNGVPDETTVNGGGISTVESSKIIQDIKEYNADYFINLDEKQQIQHKQKLDKLLNHIKSNTTNKEDEALQKLFNRNWNFAEILDFDKKHIDTTRLERLRKIYNKFEKSTDFIDEGFMIPGLSLNNYDLKAKDFGTDARNEILNKYLEMDGNIYDNIGFAPKEEDFNFEDELPLLFAHFRWMVERLSEYDDSKQRDLMETTNNTHRVPIKK